MKIKFNEEFRRWEVYATHPVVRGGELQPAFVSADYKPCVAFLVRVRRLEGRA